MKITTSIEELRGQDNRRNGYLHCNGCGHTIAPRPLPALIAEALGQTPQGHALTCKNAETGMRK